MDKGITDPYGLIDVYKEEKVDVLRYVKARKIPTAALTQLDGKDFRPVLIVGETSLETARLLVPVPRGIRFASWEFLAKKIARSLEQTKNEIKPGAYSAVAFETAPLEGWEAWICQAGICRKPSIMVEINIDSGTTIEKGEPDYEKLPSYKELQRALRRKGPQESINIWCKQRNMHLVNLGAGWNPEIFY